MATHYGGFQDGGYVVAHRGWLTKGRLQNAPQYGGFQDGG
jgi:hypothetical protein